MTNTGLYRSNRSRMIAGVMGGIAERFGWNANLVRIIFILVSVLSAAFPGILVYIVLWFVMPKKKEYEQPNYSDSMRTIYDDQK